MTTEKIIKNIQMAVALGYPLSDEETKFLDAALDAAASNNDRLHNADGSEWISVKDERKPPVFTVVLITDGDCIDFGAWQGRERGWDSNFSYIDKEDITHWMPLPEPPTEGE